MINYESSLESAPLLRKQREKSSSPGKAKKKKKKKKKNWSEGFIFIYFKVFTPQINSEIIILANR